MIDESLPVLQSVIFIANISIIGISIILHIGALLLLIRTCTRRISLILPLLRQTYYQGYPTCNGV